MCNYFIDSEVILLGNEQWTQLVEKWGKPVDLETEDELPTRLQSVFSSLDLRQSTFDSSSLVNKVRRKVGRRVSKYGTLDYKEFLQDLKQRIPYEQSYFINGHVFSAQSIEEICEKIDDVFKSVEKLSSAPSTAKRRPIPDIVNCSISIDDLSFDDTTTEDTLHEEDDRDGENLEMYLDEAFEKLSLLSHNLSSINDDNTIESVTSLVNKYSLYLSKPMANCSPRRRRQYSTRVQELTEFWNNIADFDGVREQ